MNPPATPDLGEGMLRRILRSTLGRVLLLLVCCELVLRILFHFRASDVHQLYGDDRIRAAYPQLSLTEAVALLEDTYLPLEYEAFTGFRERPRTGPYLNVVREGYRKGRFDVPWPVREEAINVFFFGGSTTFGYGAMDSTTVPAFVEARVSGLTCTRPVHVYNFGRGWYYSSQEQALFERLLRAGIRPTVAVFIDGTNDSEHDADLPFLSAETARLFEYNQGGIPLGDVARIGLFRTAIGRFALGVARRLAPTPPEPEPSPGSLDSLGRMMVTRWHRAHDITEAVAQAEAVRTVTVIQPSPYYQMDLATHPFRDWIGSPARRGAYFAELDRERGAGGLAGVQWLAGLQQGRDGKALYVDGEHYTAAFAAEIADSIMRPLGAALPECRGGAKGGVR